MNKIYFCGSIRGGRNMAAFYVEIVKILSLYGKVLTEHVADNSAIGRELKSMTDKQIYERDRSWLDQSNMVVAEVSIPSLGVGYEIAYATERHIPLLCLYNQGSEYMLSAMIAGCPGLELIKYSEVGELNLVLADFVSKNSNQGH